MEIGVRYDGADLTEVAELVGLTTDEVIAAHTGQAWTVGFCGFAPGFGYLHGENADLRVPRRAHPRTSVPAGAVGLADVWSGIYPRQGPGGWQLIGRTTQIAVGPGPDPAGPAAARHRRSASSPRAADVLVVDRTGAQALLQDLGRGGHAHLGVSPSGAADRAALRLANRLVGNPEDAAAIECLLGGLAVTAAALHWVAVTGAPTEVLVNGTRVGSHASLPLRPGDTLAIAAPPEGLRSYLAVRGGFQVAATLGSRSTDVLSGLGPEPLAPRQGAPGRQIRAGRLPGTDLGPGRPDPGRRCRCCRGRAGTGSPTTPGRRC